MVGPAGVLNADGRHAEVAKRREPLLEKRAHRFVLLEIDAANASAAIIQIEVTRQLRMLRLERQRHRIREMRLDVPTRAKQALLFATPQGEAHRSIQPKVERFQHAHDLDYDCAAGAVVGSASAAMPGIE